MLLLVTDSALTTVLLLAVQLFLLGTFAGALPTLTLDGGNEAVIDADAVAALRQNIEEQNRQLAIQQQEAALNTRMINAYYMALAQQQQQQQAVAAAREADNSEPIDEASPYSAHMLRAARANGKPTFIRFGKRAAPAFIRFGKRRVASGEAERSSALEADARIAH